MNRTVLEADGTAPAKQRSPKEAVAEAVAEAVRRGVICFDAVKQLVIGRIERRPPRLSPRLARPWLLTMVGPLITVSVVLIWIAATRAGWALLFQFRSDRSARAQEGKWRLGWNFRSEG